MSDSIKSNLADIISDKKITKADEQSINTYLSELDKLEDNSKSALQELMKECLTNTLKSGYKVNNQEDYEFLQNISTKFNLGITLPSYNTLLVSSSFGIILKLDNEDNTLTVYSGVYKKRAGYIQNGTFMSNGGFFDTYGNGETNTLNINTTIIEKILKSDNTELFKNLNISKTLIELNKVIKDLNLESLDATVKIAIKTKLIQLLEAGFEGIFENDQIIVNINNKIPLGIEGIQSIVFGGYHYKLIQGKIQKIDSEQEKTAQASVNKQKDTERDSGDQGANDPLSQAADDADKSREAHDKKLAQKQNNPYYNEKGAELKNNSRIIGEYTANTLINKRDLKGNDIGNVNKGETLKINGHEINLGGQAFYQAEGANQNLFYVAAQYLTKKETTADAQQTNAQDKNQQKTASSSVNQSSVSNTETKTAEKTQKTDTSSEESTSPEKVEAIAPISISAEDFNKAIQAMGRTITLENGIKIRKVTNGFRVTENDVSYRVSEKSVMEKGNRFYKSPTNINEALLSAKNTETAKEELATIKDEIEKITMKTSDFFTEPLKPHEQAWIDTLSGDEVTLNNILITKDHNNNTVITFDIDDRGINDDINSNFQYIIGSQGIYPGNDYFKKIVISELQKKIYEEPKREEILVKYEKIKDALNRALQNPNKKQEIGEMYNEKITIEFDGSQFYAQIGSDSQIGLTQIRHSSNEITFPEGYLDTVLKDAIEGKVEEYNTLKAKK